MNLNKLNTFLMLALFLDPTKLEQNDLVCKYHFHPEMMTPSSEQIKIEEDKPLLASNITNNSETFWHDWPNVCNTFSGKRRNSGIPKFKNDPTQKSEAEYIKEKSQRMLKLVASEMGADHRLFWIWARRGSDFLSTSVHVMDDDIIANYNSYNAFKWTQEKENELLALNNHKAKYELSKIQIYKENKFYNLNYLIPIAEKDGKISYGNVPVFSMAYGPLDTNSAFYLKGFDKNSPPWISCNHYGMVDYVIGIWAARNFARECYNLTDEKGKRIGNSYGVIDRRYARGHCMPASGDFRKRARGSLNPDAPAKLGTKFPQNSTDRKEFLTHLISRAIEEGIIEETY